MSIKCKRLIIKLRKLFDTHFKLLFESSNLEGKLIELNDVIRRYENDFEFRKRIGATQYKLMKEQRMHMIKYLYTLNERLDNYGINY